MARYGGNIAGKIISGVILTILTLAMMVVLAVLIYCSVKGMSFGEGFKSMFSFLYNQENVAETKKTAETIAKICLKNM